MIRPVDAKRVHKQEIAALYRKRGEIEPDLRTIKSDMNMEMLHYKTPEMVKKDIPTMLQKEPLTQLQRVEMENRLQEYQHQAGETRVGLE